MVITVLARIIDPLIREHIISFCETTRPRKIVWNPVVSVFEVIRDAVNDNSNRFWYLEFCAIVTT